MKQKYVTNPSFASYKTKFSWTNISTTQVESSMHRRSCFQATTRFYLTENFLHSCKIKCGSGLGTRLYVLHVVSFPLQFQSAFQSSTLIGWVRVGLGCCQGNSTNVHIVMYNNYIDQQNQSFKSTLEYLYSQALLSSLAGSADSTVILLTQQLYF